MKLIKTDFGNFIDADTDIYVDINYTIGTSTINSIFSLFEISKEVHNSIIVSMPFIDALEKCLTEFELSVEDVFVPDKVIAYAERSVSTKLITDRLKGMLFYMEEYIRCINTLVGIDVPLEMKCKWNNMPKKGRNDINAGKTTDGA